MCAVLFVCCFAREAQSCGAHLACQACTLPTYCQCRHVTVLYAMCCLSLADTARYCDDSGVDSVEAITTAFVGVLCNGWYAAAVWAFVASLLMSCL